ncbi:MAG TPA: hypothetical protein VNG33_13000, partial [Polyangiaceae bacterium]|nr:hypothetical protein [Polyangiaceae bacterium]
SIDSVLQLGSFSWAMLVAFLALVPAQVWAWAERRWTLHRTPCVLHFDPESGASLMLCRVVKRLDALGLVTFRALDDESPKKAEKGLCVSVAGEKSVSGWEALLCVSDALWCGRRPLLLLAPLLRRRVTRRLTQLATDAQELDRDLGLEAVPAEADARRAEPSAASRFYAGVLGAVRESAVAFLLVVCGTQVLLDNVAVPHALKPGGRPALFDAVTTYPRIFQGWSMFAPAPPLSDGRLVIDGRTKDGRHFDPLTGSAPVFEVHPAGTPRTNLIWGYFHTRIAEERFSAYWSGVRDFLMSHHKLTGRAQDELTSFDAYFVSQTFPAPGEKPPPPERRKLFSSNSAPVAPVQAPVPHPKSRPAKPRAQ